MKGAKRGRERWLAAALGWMGGWVDGGSEGDRMHALTQARANARTRAHLVLPMGGLRAEPARDLGSPLT